MSWFLQRGVLKGASGSECGHSAFSEGSTANRPSWCIAVSFSLAALLHFQVWVVFVGIRYEGPQEISGSFARAQDVTMPSHAHSVAPDLAQFLLIQEQEPVC
jgi:hypothetical protein